MGSPDSDKDAEADEKPAHRVRITRGFYLGKYEVTVGQFRRFVEAIGYQTEAEKDGKGSYVWEETKKVALGSVEELAAARLPPGRRPPGCERELERRGGVLRVAGEGGWPALSSADGGGVGVCVPRGDEDAVLEW